MASRICRHCGHDAALHHFYDTAQQIQCNGGVACTCRASHGDDSIFTSVPNPDAAERAAAALIENAGPCQSEHRYNPEDIDLPKSMTCDACVQTAVAQALRARDERIATLEKACSHYAHALSRIDWIAENGKLPDYAEQWVSGFDVHCNEDEVVKSVAERIAELLAACESTKRSEFAIQGVISMASVHGYEYSGEPFMDLVDEALTPKEPHHD